MIAVTIYTGAIPMSLGTAAWFALVKLLPAQVAGLSSIAIPNVAVMSGVIIRARAAVAPAGGGHRLDGHLSLWLALMPARSS